MVGNYALEFWLCVMQYVWFSSIWFLLICEKTHRGEKTKMPIGTTTTKIHKYIHIKKTNTIKKNYYITGSTNLSIF